MFFIIIGMIFILAAPRVSLFYDAPEYLSIVSQHSFSESLVRGHDPIKPVFMAALWTGVHFLTKIPGIPVAYAGNLIATLFGIGTMLILYAIFRVLSRNSGKKPSFVPLIIFFLFPPVFIISTNLMVESVALFFFTLLVLMLVLLEKRKTWWWYGLVAVVVALLLGTHIETLMWIPAAIGLSVVLMKDKKGGQEFRLIAYKICTGISSGIMIAIALYGVILAVARQPIVFELQRLLFGRVGAVYDFSRPLWQIVLIGLRNVWLQLSVGYGLLTVLLLGGIGIAQMVRYWQNKQMNKVLGLGLIILSLIMAGSSWTGDFMQRRIVFVGVIFAFLLWHWLQKKSWLILFTAYLFPFWLAVFLLYIRPSGNFPLIRMRMLEEQLPSPSLVIQTHYVRPFTRFTLKSKSQQQNGVRYLWLGQNDLSEIDTALEQGIPVFLESQALYAPYLLMTGNTLHLTSTQRVGVSESQLLFSRYIVSAVLRSEEQPNLPHHEQQRAFIFQLKKPSKVEETVERVQTAQTGIELISFTDAQLQPGKPFLIYVEGLQHRIHRERLNYGDAMMWLWVLIMNRQEPFAWTYTDAEGNAFFPNQREYRVLPLDDQKARTVRIF